MIALILKLVVQISSLFSLKYKSIFFITNNNLIQGQLRFLPPQKSSNVLFGMQILTEL